MQANLSLFPIRVGDGRKATELLKAGRYDGMTNYAKTFVEQQFPICVDKGMVDLVVITVPKSVTMPQMLDYFESNGFDRPHAEDALRFGAAYPNEARSPAIVFLHEPFKMPGGKNGHVLVHYATNEKPRLLNHSRVDDSEWPAKTRFAARRKRS